MRVSCLTVTLPIPARLPLLRRAIHAYCAQGHADRDLVIVVDAGRDRDRRAIVDHVAALDRTDIALHLPETKLTLGALRNLSVAKAQGDLLCQWDDDDLHHPDRLAAQVAALDAAGATAILLADVLLYRAADRVLYWTNWARTPAGGHPATLLCRAETPPLYPETGPDAERGEDLVAVRALAARGLLRHQADAPHLYGYVTHAANVSGAAHHRMLTETLAISTGLVRRREAMLRAGLVGLDLGAAPVTVMGANGPAFML